MPVLLEAGNRAFGDLLPSTLRLAAKLGDPNSTKRFETA